MQELSSASKDFYRVVVLLRLLQPRYRMLAHYAANYWDDERLLNAEANGDLPGNPGGFKDPEQDLAPVLKLVFDREDASKA